MSTPFDELFNKEKRDFFAAMALIGVLASNHTMSDEAAENPSKAAEWAYQYADAMLEQREEPIR